MKSENENPSPAGNSPFVRCARVILGRRIIRRREAAGLTQARLAKAADIPLEVLDRIERGEKTPDPATTRKIVRAIEKAEISAAVRTAADKLDRRPGRGRGT